MMYVAGVVKSLGLTGDLGCTVFILAMVNGSFYFSLSGKINLFQFKDRIIPNYWLFFGYISYTSCLVRHSER